MRVGREYRWAKIDVWVGKREGDVSRWLACRNAYCVVWKLTDEEIDNTEFGH
jgi:hypothetical protein